MRVNVKTSDTGTERLDWEHIDGVRDVDIKHGCLRLHFKKHAAKSGRSIDLDKIDYYHVTELDEEED